jgi:tetratricopeptide (TPR) repeat protein
MGPLCTLLSILSVIVAIAITRAGFSEEPVVQSPPRQASQTSTELGDRIQRLEDLANVDSGTSSAMKNAVFSSDLLARLKEAIHAEIAAPFQAFAEAQQEGDLDKMAKASGDWMKLLTGLKANPEDPGVRFLTCIADSCRRMAQLPLSDQEKIRRAFRLSEEADAFIAEKRYAQAVERGRQATAVYCEQLGASDSFSVLSRLYCGRMLVLAGENEFALQELDRTVEDCAAGRAGNSALYTILLEEQAKICRYLKEQERLLACLRRTATAWKGIASEPSTQHVKSLRILATELVKGERFEEAGRVCEEAIQTAEPVKAKLDLVLELATIHMMYAAVCYKQGNFPTAVESLQTVIGAAEKERPADPETISEFYDFLADVLEKADRSQEAEQARARAEFWRLQIQMSSEFPLPKSN